LLCLDGRSSTSVLPNISMHVTERFTVLGLGRQVICITLTRPSQELLLEKAWSTDFEKRLSWLSNGQFQGCGSTLTLPADSQDLLQPFETYRLA
jgi:hypothetical protein